MNIRKWLAWLDLLNVLAIAVARSEGKDERALRYLGAATELARAVPATESDLIDLKAKYEAEVANNTPTTASDLDGIVARVTARDAAIQSP